MFYKINSIDKRAYREATNYMYLIEQRVSLRQFDFFVNHYILFCQKYFFISYQYMIVITWKDIENLFRRKILKIFLGLS